jgi:hypothetical protein
MAGLVIYKEIAGLLGAAGDAIIKITDGIKHLITTGFSGYSYIAAERERKRLIELSALATDLSSTAQVRVVRSIDEYLESSDPTPDDWFAVTQSIGWVLTMIGVLLDDIKKERSEFVLESAYQSLLRSLDSRFSLLDKLSNVPPPTTEEERKEVKQISNKYKEMLTAFSEAIEQLNIYIKNKKGT